MTFYSSSGNKHVPLFENSEYLERITKHGCRKWKLIGVPKDEHHRIWCPDWVINGEHFFLVKLLDLRVYCCGCDDVELDFTLTTQTDASDLFDRIGEAPLSIRTLRTLGPISWANGI